MLGMGARDTNLTSVLADTHPQKCPAALTKCAGRFVSAILKSIAASDARSEENINATENAVSTLGKLCKYVGTAAQLDTARLLTTWLANLPLSEDEMEAEASYSLLCDFVGEGHPHIMGANGANVPRIVNVMATALIGVEGGDGSETVSRDTCLKIASLLPTMQAGHRAAMGKAWSGLSAAQQQAIRLAMASRS